MTKSKQLSFRFPDPNEPQRAPDGEVPNAYDENHSFYFWLGDEAPDYDEDVGSADRDDEDSSDS